MLEAMRSVQFQADNLNHGAGIVVLETGRVFGGDSGYYYLGNYEATGNGFNANVHIQHFAGAKNNIFGPVDGYDLQLTAQGDRTQLTGMAVVRDAPGRSLSFIMRRLAELP